MKKYVTYIAAFAAMSLMSLLLSCIEKERPLLSTVPGDARMVAKGRIPEFLSGICGDTVWCGHIGELAEAADTSSAVLFETDDGELLLTMRVYSQDKAKAFGRDYFGRLSRYEDLFVYTHQGGAVMYVTRTQLWITLMNPVRPKRLWRILKESRKSSFEADTIMSGFLGLDGGMLRAVRRIEGQAQWMPSGSFIAASVADGNGFVDIDISVRDGRGGMVEPLPGLVQADLSDLGMLPSGCVFKAAAGIGDIDWGDIGKEVSRRLPFGMKAFVPLAEKIMERVDGTVVFGVTSGEEKPGWILVLPMGSETDADMTLRESCRLLKASGVHAMKYGVSGVSLSNVGLIPGNVPVYAPDSVISGGLSVYADGILPVVNRHVEVSVDKTVIHIRVSDD